MQTATTLLLSTTIPPQVITDYAIKSGLPSHDVELLARELEKFLWLCAHAAHHLVPSPAIDAIWHDFILHTRDYEAFCTQNFGKFIHHVPQRGHSQGLRTSYLATIETIRTAFGGVDEAIWPHSEAYLNEVCTSNTCRNCNND